MDTIRHLYRIGRGPSSSHTMGPVFAAERFLYHYPDSASYLVTLYGSLAATGKGHFTDRALLATLPAEKTAIEWRPDITLPYHPNGMNFKAFDKKNHIIGDWTAYSVGGGAVTEEGQAPDPAQYYHLSTMDTILSYCSENGKQLWEYVEECEGSGIWEYLEKIWHAMCDAVHRGITAEGVLPGALKLPRKARSYYEKSRQALGNMRHQGLVMSYALAVAEENAAAGIIATAPTCGSAGILPAVLFYLSEHDKYITMQQILRALATAGLIGNLIKYNASISGAEVGCQGEVGAACSMASGAVAYLMGGTNRQVEYAAEMGLEHNLGLTCDPVDGYVQIPCIERNANAATRATDDAIFALLSDGSHRISFDQVVEVMKETGHDLPSPYRETATGGLAKEWKEK